LGDERSWEIEAVVIHQHAAERARQGFVGVAADLKLRQRRMNHVGLGIGGSRGVQGDREVVNRRLAGPGKIVRVGAAPGDVVD
jgi:hypothetical protein